MNDTERFNYLRARYRTLWDGCQVIAHANATLLKAGKHPSNEQLINEQKAADAVQSARSELLAAIAHAEHQARNRSVPHALSERRQRKNQMGRLKRHFLSNTRSRGLPSAEVSPGSQCIQCDPSRHGP